MYERTRDAIRQGFSVGLVSDGSGWMDMLQTRNRTAHTYNEGVAREVAAVMDARAAREDRATEVTDIPGLDARENKALRMVFAAHPAVRHVVVYDSIEDDGLRDHIDRVGVSFYRVL